MQVIDRILLFLFFIPGLVWGGLSDVLIYTEVRADVRDVVKDIKKNSWEAANEFRDESVDFIFRPRS